MERVLAKLGVMKQYEKKKLSKYDLIECRNLGRIQLNPYVRTPLTFDFKLDDKLSKSPKLSISGSPAIHNGMQDGGNSVCQPKRPKSALSTCTTRKDHSGKPTVRPFSAPSYLKRKPSYQSGTVEDLGRGFRILKLSPKLKVAHLTTELQKRSQTVSWGEGKTPKCMDQLVGSRRQDRLEVAEKDINDELRNQAISDLRKEAKSCINGHMLLDYQSARTSPQKDNLTTKGERTRETNEDAILKEKIPLCIEDELEKPNAKVIKPGCSKAKHHSPMKASESFPIFCHNEEYVQGYSVNRWLSLCEEKALYDMNKKNESCMCLNPVLRNNYNEAITIIRSKIRPRNITTKRKQKPALSGKPKHITIQILSVEGTACGVPSYSQKVKPFVQQQSRSVAKTISKQEVTKRGDSQNVSKGNKEILMVYGVNPKFDRSCHTSTRSLISGIKSQLPDFFEKTFSPDEKHKRVRMLYVDYIPISKQIPVPKSGVKPVACDPSLSAHSSSPLNNCTNVESVEGNKSQVYHWVSTETKLSLDGIRSDESELSSQQHQYAIEEGSVASSISLGGFWNSLQPSKSGKLDAYPEDPAHPPVISIPTAQFDSSDHRMQRPGDA